MLMNQTHKERTVTVRLDSAKIGLIPGDGTLFDGNADPVLAAKATATRTAPTLADGAFTVMIAPLSMATLCYPAKAREEFPDARPLASSHRTVGAGAFGEAHAFTIRSPWGKDAVYTVLTADPIPGAKVVFTCDGTTRSCERFPYEASFYPVSDPHAPVRITTFLPDKAESVISLD